MDLLNKLLDAFLTELQKMAAEQSEGDAAHVVLSDLVKLVTDVKAKLAAEEEPVAEEPTT